MTLPDQASVQAFIDQIRGDVLRPDEAGYDEARAVWNGMIDRRPAIIARCRGAADVMRAVDFAREHHLLLSVKGGGHSAAGKAVCDDGLMIDLSLMKWVRVDPDARRAHVGPGTRLGDLDHETQAFGLATTSGIDSRTGVAGLTLGGGVGFLARRFGLTIDNLVGADVVTAAGELVRASEEENPDLFWGLRGGGGNFGVVTSFEFQLHEVGPEVTAAQIFYPYSEGKQVLQKYREFMAGAPDELTMVAAIVRVPPVLPFPEEFHGKLSVALIACHSGSLEEGRAALAPLQDFGAPILDVIQPMPYKMLQQSLDAGTPAGARYYWKTQYLGGLPDDAIDTMMKRMETLPGQFSSVTLEPGGGAIDRVDPTATAFPHRNTTYNLGIWPGWADPDEDEQNIAWARQFHEKMAPFSTGAVYVNYIDREGGERVRAAYGENYDRLLRLKRKWDPDNLFRVNQNIDPKGDPEGNPETRPEG